MKFVERITGMFTKPDETTKDITNEPRIEEAVVNRRYLYDTIIGITYIIIYSHSANQESCRVQAPH